MYQIVLRGPTDPKYANAAVRAGGFLLKALNPELYADRIKVEATVSVNTQVGVVLSARGQFRAEQLAELKQLQELRTLDMNPVWASARAEETAAVPSRSLPDSEGRRE